MTNLWCSLTKIQTVMKKTICITASFLLVVVYLTAQKSNLEIPPKGSLELDYANYELYELRLRNTSAKSIGIKVVNKETDEFVRGFGLGALGKVEVLVEQGNKIVFTNTSKKMGKLNITFREMQLKKTVSNKDQRISFTLINPSDASIPLIIPNVMKPNLSPNSSSGVDLKIGQILLFRNGLKRYTLLTVDNSIKNGQEVDVYEILQQRKKELGLK